MWTFIPILPSKYAWDNKLMPDLFSLRGIGKKMLEDKRAKYLRGYIYFKPPNESDLTWPSRAFSGPRELNEILEELKWGEDPTQPEIRKVWLSGHGWWHGSNS